MSAPQGKLIFAQFGEIMSKHSYGTVSRTIQPADAVQQSSLATPRTAFQRHESFRHNIQVNAAQCLNGPFAHMVLTLEALGLNDEFAITYLRCSCLPHYCPPLPRRKRFHQAS